MWTPIGESTPDLLRQITPDEVLYYFDEPLLFTCRSLFPMLCYKIDESAGISQYLSVQTNPEIILQLRNGNISVRSALWQPWCWIVETDDEFRVRRSWGQSIQDVPARYLPERNYGLYYEHGVVQEKNKKHTSSDAFLSIHFQGGLLKTKEVMGFGVFKTLVDEAYTSIWRIFTPALYKMFDTERQLRRVINIPVRQPMFASLLIEIERPRFEPEIATESAQSEILQAQNKIDQANIDFLDSAEVVANAAKTGAVSKDITVSNLAALEIVSRLAPTDRSSYDIVEIAGYIESKGKTLVTVGQETGDIIRRAYRIALDESKTFRGKVIEVNAQSGSVIIMTPGYRQITCVMTSGTQRELMREITTGAEISVSGAFEERKRRDKIYVRTLRILDGMT